MKDIEKKISALVESQFPAFYQEEGQKFISFVQAYYEWLEEANNATYQSRRLLNYRDIDETLEEFIIHFKEKFLSNIQFTTVSNKKLLVKKSQDLYKSKGSERSVDLFFKLVYGLNAEIYVPGEDIFRLSDGEWIKPEYLEITRQARNISYVGKQVRGADSGAIAFVEKLVRRRIQSKYVDIFYISARLGTFVTNEILLIDNVYDDAPTHIGSLTTFDLIDKSSGYVVGDIVEIISEGGLQGKARVSAISNVTGVVEFEFIDGGFGYTTTSNVLISEKVLVVNNVIMSNTITLDVSNVISNSFVVGEKVTQGSNTGFVYTTDVSSNVGSIILRDVKGTFTTSGNIVGATSGAQSAVSNAAPISLFITPFKQFETITQPIANVVYQSVLTFSISSNTGAFTNNEVIFQSTSGSNTALARVVSSNSSVIVARFANTGEFSTALQIRGASSLSNAVISSFSTGERFAEGDLYTNYYTNGAIAGQGLVVQTFTNATPYVGVLKIAISNGNINDSSNTNYSQYFYVGNTSSVNTTQATVNTYINVSATANVIGISNTVILYTSEYTPTFNENEIINQGNTANGVITSYEQTGSNVAITVGSVKGIFKRGERVVGANSAASANVQAFGTNIGLYDIENTFTNSAFHYIIGNTSYTTANVMIVSAGTGASFQIGSLDNEEQIVIGIDYISGRNESNVVYRTLPLNSTVFEFPKFPAGNVTHGTLLQQLTYVTANIGTISAITNINPGSNYNIDPFVTVYNDFIALANRKDLFISYQRNTTNVFIDKEIVEQSIVLPDTISLSLSSVISNSFVVGELINNTSNTANGYVRSTNITANTGTIVLRNTRGTFSAGANVIGFTSGAQSNVSSVNAVAITSVAKGIVRSSNSSVLTVKPITFNTQFFAPGSIKGRSSSANASILSIDIDVTSNPSGVNAQILGDVVTANGIVSELQRLDSGFGYLQDEVSTFTKEGKLSGRAKLNLGQHGVGEGYYKSSKGFLSQDKYIFDGDYYQEYSYQILSKLPFERYSNIFKQVMHTAGTRVFGAVILDSLGDSTPIAIENIDKIYTLNVTGMPNTSNYAVGEVIYQSNGTANIATGKLLENKSTTIVLTTSANTQYQIGEKIHQPNSSVNAASGVLSGKIANVSANTLTLYVSNTQGTFTATANIQGTTNTVLNVAANLKTQFRNNSNPSLQTGSFDLGETVTTSGGFSGVIEVANEFDAEIIPVSGSLSVDDQLTGANSAAVAFIESVGPISPTVGVKVYQAESDLYVHGVNGTFSVGEYVFQRKQNTNRTDQSFQFTTYGTVKTANSSVIVLKDKFGTFTKDEILFGATANATAIVDRIVTSNSAVGTVIAANSTAITMINTSGEFLSNSRVYSTNTAAKIVSINKSSYIAQTSNVASAINSILVANVSGNFITEYQIKGANSMANAIITYIETHND
jgi:hypothetical protein